MRSLEKILAAICAVLLIASALWYGGLAFANQIRPSVATFMLVLVYLSISEMTYR